MGSGNYENNNRSQKEQDFEKEEFYCEYCGKRASDVRASLKYGQSSKSKYVK